MTRDDVPRLPRGVRLHFDAVRQAHVLLAPERAFNVNKTAVAVLQLVDGRRSIGDIVATLGRDFKDAPPTLERDVIVMLDDLAAKRVMER
jgi:pyrroloquinoline quinone biosynthesis protein D